MQFSCESCKAQLQIADEKVRGKRLIVRCKRCGAKIALADPLLSKVLPHVVEAPPVSAGGAPAAVADTDNESTRAMDSDVLERALRASRAEDASLNGSPPTQRFAAPPPAAPSNPSVWYAMLHGKQAGPLTRAELEARANEGELGPRTYVWCEGMDSWQRARDVLELVALFPQLPSPPSSGAAIAARSHPAPARPAAATEVEVQAAATQPAAPIVAEPAHAEAPSTPADAAAPPRPEAAETPPRNDALSKPRPVPVLAPQTVMFESAAPAQGKGPFIVFLGLMTLAVAAVVLWIVLGAAPKAADEPRPDARGGAPAQAGAPEAAASIGLTADQVRRKLDEHKPALQDCVDDALRRDPSLHVGKIHVATTIAPSGEVTDARIDQQTVDESALGACLKGATRRIVFPRFSGAPFNVDIPISVGAAQ